MDLIKISCQQNSFENKFCRAYLDFPSNNSLIDKNSIFLTGWIFPEIGNTISKLFLVDERDVHFDIPFNHQRQDVAQVFSQNPNALASGFAFLIKNTPLFPGQVKIVAEINHKIYQTVFTLYGEPSNSSTKELNEPTDASQGGEYQFISRIIKQDWPALLVDVGAHDGVSLSNSLPFIRAGWKGLLLEPMPKIFPKLKEFYKYYDNAICVNSACSDFSGTSEMYIGFDGEYGQNSTLCTDQNEWINTHRTQQSVSVQVVTLTELLETYNYPSDFSLLTIDTEGMDYEVLLGLNLNTFRPRIILTEEYECNPSKHFAKYEYLKHYGYNFIDRVGCNSLWLEKSLSI